MREGFPLHTARLLLVDDQEDNLALLERILRRAGFTELCRTTDPRQALDLYQSFRPDLILLDLHLPHLDGFALLEGFKRLIAPGEYLPVLVLTADATLEARHKALSLGANDFLTKPLDPLEVSLRVSNLLETCFLYRAVLEENRHLEERVRERTHELKQAQLEVLERLARAAEYRDDETGEHVRRVAANAARLAEALGLPQEQVEVIHSAAPLHDLGKIGIPDAILRKPGRLTPEEFAIIKTHTTIGAELLSGGRSELSRVAERIAKSHHERWDGTGYPEGLKAEEIPLEGRIVAVVDVFDALTSERPYKRAWPLEEALAEIRAQAGRQFDPRVVQAFLHTLEARPDHKPSPDEGSTG